MSDEVGALFYLEEVNDLVLLHHLLVCCQRVSSIVSILVFYTMAFALKVVDCQQQETAA